MALREGRAARTVMTVRGPHVGIVGYGMGNVRSLVNAFRAIGVSVAVAETPAELAEGTHIVLPGVGAFPMGMDSLRAGGFDEVLVRLVEEGGRPLLGVCLGMQLLASVGEEHRIVAGLGFVPGRSTRLDPGTLRVPHIGWNDTVTARDNTLLPKAGATGCFYYVHSYHLTPEDERDATMLCRYGKEFVAGVERGHVFGVQFHPEKSHGDGLAVLKRFTEVRPC